MFSKAQSWFSGACDAVPVLVRTLVIILDHVVEPMKNPTAVKIEHGLETRGLLTLLLMPRSQSSALHSVALGAC